MSLSAYKAPTRTVVLPDENVVAIHALTPQDITILIREHLPDLDALYALFDKASLLTPGDVEKIMVAVLTQAPGFVANLIALAAREPDSAPQAAQLPLGKQVEILVVICEISFTEVGEIKKLAALAAGRMGLPAKLENALSRLAENMKAP